MARRLNPRGEMPFLDHLEELRWRILWSLIAVAIGAVIGFFLVTYFNVFELLVLPVRRAWHDPNLQLIYLSPATPFFVVLRLALIVGLLLALPIVAYQLWAFLSPALEKKEKRAIVPALYLGLALFTAGVAMAYFVALPITLEFFQRFLTEELSGQLEVNSTLSFIVKLLLAFGFMFELPIVIMVLTAMGLVNPQFLRSKRRHAIVINTVLASVITPGDVIVLTLMMIVPLILLYEFSIYLSVVVHRRQVEREAELEASLSPPPGAVEAQ